ncbi:MAG: hypothetical protein IIA14_09140 [SAR324 cluster bacterium]|nr:hypothetical protein [SAR324 cluster bacterium]
MKGKKDITTSDLEKAIRKFIKRGGIIRTLPPQKSASHTVGGRWCTSELGSQLIG